MSLKRLNKELAALSSSPPEGITATPMGDNLYKWKATIEGPAGTPYEGHVFELDVEFPGEYPFKPPKVRRVADVAGEILGRFGSLPA